MSEQFGVSGVIFDIVGWVGSWRYHGTQVVRTVTRAVVRTGVNHVLDVSLETAPLGHGVAVGVALCLLEKLVRRGEVVHEVLDAMRA